MAISVNKPRQSEFVATN